MYVDGPEFFLVFAQLGTEGNILTKFKNKSEQWSWRRSDNKKCLQTDSWTDRRGDAGEFPDRKKISSGLRPEELMISKRALKLR